jgi:hypothetical protein
MNQYHRKRLDLYHWVWARMIIANLEIDGKKVSLPKIHSNYFWQ